MPRKGFLPEEIIARLREAAYGPWRQEHGGMPISQARRLKRLEREDAARLETSPALPNGIPSYPRMRAVPEPTIRLGKPAIFW